MRSFLRLFAAICIMALPFSAMAHGYWIETEGSHKAKKEVTVKLYFGDYPVGERLSGKTLDKMKDIKVFVISPAGEKQAVAMTQQDSFWLGSFTPQSKGVYEITGINDERDVQDWNKHNLGIVRPIQYLKMYYQVGKETTKPASTLTLDVVLDKKDGNNYDVKVTNSGAPIASQKLVLTSFGTGEKEIVTDANGNATLTLDKAGLHVLSIDYIDKTPGTFRDKAYESVRHRLDVSLDK